MGQGERVEGSREERHLLPAVHVEFSHQQPVLGDEPVDVRQAGCPVEMGQLPARVLFQLEVDLAAGRIEDRPFFLKRQVLRTEDLLADDQQGLLAHNLPVIGHTGQKHAHQPVPALFPGFRTLGKSRPVDGIALQDRAHRVNHGRRRIPRCSGHGLGEGADQLIQLLRRKPQGHLAEPEGNGPGIVRLAGLQIPQHFHGNLIPLVHPEIRAEA